MPQEQIHTSGELLQLPLLQHPFVNTQEVFDLYQKAAQIDSPRNEMTHKTKSVLPRFVSGLTRLYSELFDLENEDCPHDLLSNRKDEVFSSVIEKAHLHLWGLYSSKNKSAVRTITTILATVQLFTEIEKRTAYSAFDAIARMLLYSQDGILTDFIVASAQLGEVYGITSSKLLLKDKGRLTHGIETTERYFEQSKQKLEKVINMSEGKYNYLKELLVIQGNHEDDAISYLDIYLNMNGLNEEQVKYTRSQLQEKIPQLKAFGFNRLSTIVQFVESIINDTNPFIHIEKDGTVFWEENTISQRYLPQEIVVDIRKRATIEAISLLQELKESGWQIRYRARDIIDFYQFLLRAFIEELDKPYVVNDTSVYDIYPLVAERCMTYLQEKYPENELSVTSAIIMQLTLLLPKLSKDKIFLFGRSGASSITRAKYDPSLWNQKDIGLSIENAITAASLRKAQEDGNYSKISLTQSPSRLLYNFWALHPDWSWEKSAEALGLPLSSFLYAAKVAIIHTILSPEGRQRLLELEDQFPLRNTDFFDKLKASQMKGIPLKQYQQAIDTLGSLQGISRLTRYITNIAVDFVSKSDQPLPFESYILQEVAKGYSAREICRRIGFDDLKDNDPRYLIFSEMIKILVRYPLDWTRRMSEPSETFPNDGEK